MKILFVFQGTTHYFNLITSKINLEPGVEIIYLCPKSGGTSIGAGVFQTKEGANFQLIELEEKYNAQQGYLFYEELPQVIDNYQPDIVLTSEIHIKGIYLDTNVRKALKRAGSRVILKSIPFQLKKYDAHLEGYLPILEKRLKEAPLPEFTSLPAIVGKILKFFKLNVLYKKLYIDKKVAAIVLSDLNLHRSIYNFVDAHVNYIEEAYELFGSYGVPKEKIFITYNSPDTDFLFGIKEKIKNSPPLLPDCKFRIVHLSRLVEWKRVDMLVRAVHHIRPEFPEMELIVIGEGPEKQNLMALSQELGVSDSVKFLGGVYDPALLGRYLMASHIYVLAGMGGLSINDAMIFGLPVICSVCDGTEKYLVKENYNGLYFENGNQENLEAKIRYLFNNPDVRKNMGDNSVKIINDEINIHTVVKGYMNAFNYVRRK